MKKLLCLLSLISGFSYGLKPVVIDLKTEVINTCDSVSDNDEKRLCVTMGSNVHVSRYIERNTDISHVWNGSLLNITLKQPLSIWQLHSYTMDSYQYMGIYQHNSFDLSVQYREETKQHIFAIINTKPKSFCEIFYINDYKDEYDTDNKLGFVDFYLYEKTLIEDNQHSDLGVVYINNHDEPTRITIKGQKCNPNDFMKNKNIR